MPDSLHNSLYWIPHCVSGSSCWPDFQHNGQPLCSTCGSASAVEPGASPCTHCGTAGPPEQTASRLTSPWCGHRKPLRVISSTFEQKQPLLCLLVFCPLSLFLSASSSVACSLSLSILQCCNADALEQLLMFFYPGSFFVRPGT